MSSRRLKNVYDQENHIISNPFVMHFIMNTTLLNQHISEEPVNQSDGSGTFILKEDATPLVSRILETL